jgi:hypothetical protein
MASSGLASDREAPSLRALYDSALGPYLAAQDARVLAARRNRWLVLVAGLALAGGLLAWVLRRHTDNEIGPMIAFAVAVGAVGFFWLSTASLADDVRHELMSRIAAWLRLRYEAAATGFDLERFALLGLAGCDKIRRSDRLSGEAGGLGVDMMAGRLADETSTGIGSERQTRTIERFTGLLMRLGDPMPPGVRFRLVPPAQAAARNMLRDVTIVTHTHSTSRSMPPTAGLPAMQVTEPEAAPVTLTGDTAFDARFELHALGPDVPAALGRLDAGTREALLDIAGRFGGGPVSVGFDGGEILLAFVTDQRFEIGPLRPPMAQFERVQHLADQMGILNVIADRIRTACDIDTAELQPGPHTA